MHVESINPMEGWGMLFIGVTDVFLWTDIVVVASIIDHWGGLCLDDGKGQGIPINNKLSLGSTSRSYLSAHFCSY